MPSEPTDREPADLTGRDAPGVEIERPSSFWANVATAVTSRRYSIPDGADYDKDDLIDLIDAAESHANALHGTGHRDVEIEAANVARLMVACYVHSRQMDEMGQHNRATVYRDHADHLRRRLKSEGRKNLPDRVFDFDNFDAREKPGV